MSGKMRFIRFFRIGVVVAILLASILAAMIVLQTDSRPTLYHHADGRFTLNSKYGRSVSEAEVKDYLTQFMLGKMGRMRLVVSDSTTLSDLWPMLNVTSERGVWCYLLEVDGRGFSFSLPGCGNERDHESDCPEIVDLSDGHLSLEKGDPKFDVVLLASMKIQCKKLIDVTSAHSWKGKSLVVVAKYPTTPSPGFWLYHGRDGEAWMGDFKSVHVGFFERYVEPRWEYLRAWF